MIPLPVTHPANCIITSIFIRIAQITHSIFLYILYKPREEHQNCNMDSNVYSSPTVYSNRYSMIVICKMRFF